MLRENSGPTGLTIYLACGSSPRAWGTLRRNRRSSRTRRFIPTCMGNSPVSRSSRAALAVHPHVHGELPSAVCEQKYSTGSSPRAWGTHHRDRARAHGRRFIPTCMGNSLTRGGVFVRCPVHPRVCGELLYVYISESIVFGSSPRMWGTHRLGKYMNYLVRFIPAYVGNSSG